MSYCRVLPILTLSLGVNCSTLKKLSLAYDNMLSEADEYYNDIRAQMRDWYESSFILSKM